MKKTFYMLIFLILGCNPNIDESPILKFQKSLVNQGITGSNTAMVYKDGNIIYNQTVNSGAIGDANIDENTIFAIHSMTKTVTTVAMMILLDQERYDLNDPLSK